MPKQKKNPDEDEILHFLDRVFNFAVLQWKKITVLSAIILVIVIAGILVSNHMEQRRKALELTYYEIMQIEDEDQKIARLEEFSTQHKKTDISYLADMALASYYYQKNDTEKSKNLYSKVIDETSGDLIHFLAIDSIVPIHLELGEYEAAANIYLNASKEFNNPWPDEMKYKAGYIFEIAKNYDKAKEVFESIVNNEKAATSTKMKAEEQLLWISSLGTPSDQK